MSRPLWPLAALLASLPLQPALAQDSGGEEADFCADRPGLGTPACTLPPGTVMLEVGGVSWERSRNALTTDDEVTLGDALLRLGIGPTTEVQVGLATQVIQRSKNRLTGAVERHSGVGDGTIAIRQGLAGPGGPVALQAFLTVPVGEQKVGQGRWSGGLQLPVEFDLPNGFGLSLMPAIELNPNESRTGHHIAWGGVAGLSRDLSQQLSLTAELGVTRDDDPDEPATDARLAGSLAWRVGADTQLDFEVNAGLSSGAPDHAIAIGFVQRFR